MFNSAKRRAKKIRKLEDNIADLKHAKDTWGFSWSPSRHRAVAEEISDLEYKLAKLEEQDAR